MLTIRKRNLVVLAEARRRGMPDRLVTYLMARFPDLFKGEDANARAVVDRACATAAEYGINDDEEVGLFADLMVMYGDDFHREPWAANVLKDEKLSQTEKMYELRDRVYKSGALM